MSSILHPAIDIQLFTLYTKLLYPRDCRELIVRMRYAIEYDDPTYITNSHSINRDLLHQLSCIIWHTHSYIKECYILGCYHMCIFFLRTILSDEVVYNLVTDNIDYQLLSSLIIKCIYEEEELANRLLRSLHSIYKDKITSICYFMWEVNIELRYFMISFQENCSIRFKLIQPQDRQYNESGEPINPIYYYTYQTIFLIK